MPVRRPVLLLAAAAVAGCYSYTPILATPEDVSTPVRLHLTDAGSVALAPLIGPQVEDVDGRLISAADTVFELAMLQTDDRRGVETPWRGERVTFPRSAVASVQRRTLDKARSWGLAAVGAVAVALVARSANILGGSGTRSGGTSGGKQ